MKVRLKVVLCEWREPTERSEFSDVLVQILYDFFKIFFNRMNEAIVFGVEWSDLRSDKGLWENDATGEIGMVGNIEEADGHIIKV